MSEDLSYFIPIASRRPLSRSVLFNGADFKTYFWAVPEGKVVKGRILFVHGFSEYYKAYQTVFEQISDAGYEVFFFDQRGAGFTSLGHSRGVTNEFHTFNDLNNFVEQNLKEIRDSTTHSDKRIFLGGHSMGGGIVLNYGVNGKYKSYIRGIFVTGPEILLSPQTRPGFIQFHFLKIISYIAPKLKYHPTIRVDSISSDPNSQEFLDKDLLMQPEGTLGQLRDLIQRGEKLLIESYNKDFSVPVLILHGTEDKLNDPNGSKRFISAISIEDKQIELIEGAEHSLFLERKDLYDKTKKLVLDWLDKH